MTITKPDVTPRIVHVVSGDLWGGAEAQVADLLRELQSRSGIGIAAVVMNKGLLSERLAGAGVRVLVLDESRMHLGQLFAAASRFVDPLQPCLFHSHRRKEHVLAAMLALRFRARCIASVHGHSESGGVRPSLAQRCNEWANRMVLRHVHAKVIAVSAELGEQLRPLYGPDNVIVIRNGLGAPWEESAPRDDLHAESQRLNQGAGANTGRRRKIAFFGRLVPVKRVDLFVEVCRILIDRRPGEFLFQIYGDGPLRTELEAQSRRLGLTGTLSFEGFTATPRVHIRQVDCVALTSDREGLPMIALEALDCGTPLVCPAVGGLPELVTASGFGALVRERSAAAFADAIERTLAEHPKGVDDVNGSRLPYEYTVAASAAHYAVLYGKICAPAT